MKGGGMMDQLFKALSVTTRLRILSLLLRNNMCVCQIEGSLKLRQSNASRHLSVLRQAGILESYKVAQWTYYRISENFIEDSRELYNYLLSETEKLAHYKKDYERYRQWMSKNKCGGESEQKRKGIDVL